MHINEAYEHAPILPYPGEEGCPSGGCNKVGTQFVDITAPMTLTPVTETGTPTVNCQGTPCVTCCTDKEGKCCTVTVTQRVSVAVPIRYSVTVCTADPAIACVKESGNCSGYGAPNCGC